MTTTKKDAETKNKKSARLELSDETTRNIRAGAAKKVAKKIKHTYT